MRTAAAILEKRDIINTKNSYMNLYKEEQKLNEETRNKYKPKSYVYD